MSISNRTIQNQKMIESEAPNVVSTTPADNASTNNCGTSISVTFDESMDVTSVTSNTGVTCSGTIQVSLSANNFSNCVQMASANPTRTNDNKTFTVTPSDNLTRIATYKIKVKGGDTGVKDPSGNPMSSDNTTGTGFNTAGSKGVNGCL